MIVLIGASASGKTEIAKILYKHFHYEKIITTTTRQPRYGEVDGVDYHFLSKQQFNDVLLVNGFVEVTKYQDNLYGTQKEDVTENGLIILDPNGANALIEHYGDDAFIVFVKYSKQRREERMRLRGDQEESIKNRLKSDDLVFNTKNLHKVDCIIENNDQPLYDMAKAIHEAYMKKSRP